MARTITLIARNLDLAVVAEGVETAEQLAALKAIGCDDAQGYLFSPPVPPAAVAPLLDRAVRWAHEQAAGDR
jgi:EAL domain-containing protein (putative c-di-GMP-specific phosphodiesterase class I)